MKKLIGFERGINLGGWLSQGSKEKSHLDSFILEPDIKRIADMGCDHLRLPVDFENIEDNGVFKEAGFNYITSCIEWCKKYNLNVVLDLHKAPGYTFDDDAYSGNFFGNPVLEKRFLDIWDELSKRYAKYTDMMMFEMLNEVTKTEYSDLWNDLAYRCYKVIRKNCPDVKILYGGVGNSSTAGVLLLEKPWDENVIYNVHCYEPLVFTHQGAYWVATMPLDYRIDYPFKTKDYLEFAKGKHIMLTTDYIRNDTEYDLGPEFFERVFMKCIEKAEAMGTPLYCGEYGVIDRADPEASLRWLKDINGCFVKHGISRCLWSYKKMDFGIIDEHYASVIDEMIKYL